MAFNLWLTGFSGSGKSTLAARVSEYLVSLEVPHEIIDPDEIRAGFFPSVGFSDKERVTFRRSLLFLASLLNRHKVSCILPLVSSRRALRQEARTDLPNFVEVYVKCPIEVCQQRDPKGLYKRAQGEDTPNIAGLDLPYEEPNSPDLVVETNTQNVDSCTEAIISLLRQRGYVREDGVNI